MNNYTLNIANDTTAYPFKYLKAAIIAGVLGNEPFTVEMVEPSMIVCYWQPVMSEVAYNETYKRWYEDQQRELQRVTG